jgi:hypothetical protein
VNRASNLDELVPLLALCRAGKLFEVQQWIREGRPVALPAGAGAKGSRRNPLRVAMDEGFHSLVQVLLEAGAPPNEGNYRALDHAVDLRRPDLAELLFQHGAKVEDASMQFVLEMWDPAMVDLFLSRGASLERGRPVAWALMVKMRPVLGLLKRLGGEMPDLMVQAAIALRYHALEGNPKWVSLLLWAGADPCERGPYRMEDLEEESEEDEEPPNAIELAVLYGKLDILKLPRMMAACRPPRQPTARLFDYASSAEPELLSFLFAQGHRPDSLPDRGTRAISHLVHSMTYDFSVSHPTFGEPRTSGIDSSRARERMKALHMMLVQGARWLPESRDDIGEVRRSLLKMAPGYLLEFVWLLRAYRAARRRDVVELFRTPSVNRVLSDKRATAEEILAGIPDEVADSPETAAAPTEQQA